MTIGLALEELRALTDIEQVYAQLNALQAADVGSLQVSDTADSSAKRAAGPSPEAHIQQRTQPSSYPLAAVSLLVPSIETLSEQASKLATLLSHTSRLADSISDKVRLLDTRQRNVKSTIEHIDSINNTKLCARGVVQALDDQDYELAAEYIAKVDLSKNNEIFDSTSPNSENPIAVLTRAKDSLKDRVLVLLDKAVSENKEKEIMKYIKIFPQIGYPSIGLDRFSAFLCGLISHQCQESMREISSSGFSSDKPVYANLLTRLFEFIAKLVDQQSEMILQEFGPGHLLFIINRLMKQAELQGNIILNAFIEQNNTSRKLYEIKSAAKKVMSAFSNQDTGTPIDPKDLDKLLTEQALISQRTTFFARFLSTRVKSQIASLDSDTVEAFEPVIKELGYNQKTQSLNAGKLELRVDNMIGSEYLPLEEYYIQKNLEKALKLDQYDSLGVSNTTTCVDDTFYILDVSLLRCVASLNPEAMSLLLAAVGKILQEDYIAVLNRRLGSIFNDVADGDRDARVKFMVYLNDVDASCDYIKELGDKVLAEMEKFATTQAGLLEAGKASIGLFSEYSKSFRTEVCHRWMENFFTQTIRPRLAGLFAESYTTPTGSSGATRWYIQDETAYEQNLSLFVGRFLAGFDKIMRMYKSTLTESNFLVLIGHTAVYLAKEWEKLTFASFRFTQFGALCFEKDVRAVSSHVSSMATAAAAAAAEATGSSSGYSIGSGVRDRFTRINQICALINLEGLDEVKDVWGAKASGSIKWRLSASEARKVLSLRTDFTVEEIKKLNLK